VPTKGSTPEEISALQEKANAEHCRVVARLAQLLSAAGWSNIQEIPTAVDLWALNSDGRVLFEVKTLSGSNEVHQCRAALSQLLEYRFFYGTESDRLCIVLNGPIADRRRALLEELKVAIIVIANDGTATSIGRLAHTWFGRSPFRAQNNKAILPDDT
jgi:hypothetical protein